MTHIVAHKFSPESPDLSPSGYHSTYYTAVLTGCGAVSLIYVTRQGGISTSLPIIIAVRQSVYSCLWYHKGLTSFPKSVLS